jgi:hypothetical protein
LSTVHVRRTPCELLEVHVVHIYVHFL